MALAVDSSSPAIATQATGSTATCVTASFTPPAGSVLLVMYSANTIDPNSPGTPTITDSLGAHLTYTLVDNGRRPDSPTAEGQVATWTAVVGTSAAMTVTVTNGAASPNRHAAICVQVITGADTTTPVGAHGKSASTTNISSIAQNYTAAATGGWGFLVVCDWFDAGAETAGTGCTLIGSANLASQYTYGFFRRATADDSNGATNTLRATIPNSSNIRWAWVEILPTASSTITGDATIAGAGALSAAATQIAGASPTGVGALAGASPAQQVSAALAGAGALNALSAQRAGASSAGAGALSALVAQLGSTSPTGAGALSAVVRQLGSTAPAGAGALVAPATQLGSTSPTGAGVVNAQSGGASGVAALAGAGALSAVARQIAGASAAGAGALSATVVVPGAATSTGAGALSAAATQLGNASPAGAGALSALAVQRVTLSAAGAGALSATALVLVPGSAGLTGAGMLAALATQRATAMLTGSSVLAATTSATASLTGAGVLLALGSELGAHIPLGDRLEEILDALISFTKRLGIFEAVQGHEPKSSPKNGLTAALWLQTMAPAPGASGLDSTTLRIAWFLRIYQNFLSRPEDGIDPKVMRAMAAVMEALTGNFDLDIDGVRAIDLLGAYGPPMASEAGYVPMSGGTIYRCMTLTIPVILNDAFVQTA